LGWDTLYALLLLDVHYMKTHVGAVATEFQFAGEQTDPTGLQYLRARYYDPSTGRFLSRDPFLGVGQRAASLNRYAYAEGNPAVVADPSGYFGLGDITDKIKDWANSFDAQRVQDHFVDCGTSGLIWGASGAFVGVGGALVTAPLTGGTSIAAAPALGAVGFVGGYGAGFLDCIRH
jgi:RHS repeat-associated protein